MPALLLPTTTLVIKNQLAGRQVYAVTIELSAVVGVRPGNVVHEDDLYALREARWAQRDVAFLLLPNLIYLRVLGSVSLSDCARTHDLFVRLR